MTNSKADAPDEKSPEWTEEDIRSGIPFPALPESVKKAISQIQRGRQKAPIKVPVSMRLSADVVAELRATGDGWQSRADEALREWLDRQQSLATR